jgi:hypothetical protein
MKTLYLGLLRWSIATANKPTLSASMKPRDLNHARNAAVENTQDRASQLKVEADHADRCLFMLLILLHSEVIDHELCRWRSPKARLVTRVIGKPAREQKYDGTGRSRIMG